MTPDVAGDAAFREMSALYALGSLAPDDRSAFEAHLATCAECAIDVRSLTQVVSTLARLAPPVDPPAALRARVLASIAPAIDSVSNERPSKSPGLWPSRVGLAAAASLLVALVTGSYALQLRARIGILEGHLHDAVVRADSSALQLTDLRRKSDDAQAQARVLVAPDLARVDLAGQQAAPSATARAFWSRSRGLVFNAADLPALPPGRTYQLWVVTGQSPISAGLLRPDSTGRVNAVFATPSDIPPPVAIAVTIEPDGGVSAPTGDRYLIGSVAL